MKKFLTQLALGATALFSVGAANASYVMDFESGIGYTNAPFAPLLAAGDYITEGGFFANAQTADNSTGSLVAGLSSVAGGCLNDVCPTGSTGTFLSVVNDGIMHFGSLTSSTVSITSLTAAYIAGTGAPTGSTVYLAVEGDRADKTYSSQYYVLSSTGSFQTITLGTGTALGGTGSLTDNNFTDFYVYGYFCNGTTGSCNAFSTDYAQFAVDNITFATAAVPEPSELLMMGLGLAAVGAAARRRRSI